MNAPEIALFGEWNTANLGDRMIHRRAAEFFRSCGWRVSSYALSSLVPVAEPASAREPPPPRGRAAARLPPGLRRALRGVRQEMRMLRLLPALARAQAIAVGGGALLSDVNLHFPQSLAVLTRAARAQGKPMLCLGCSAEGAWSPAGVGIVRRFLGACALIAARDAATARRVAELLGRSVPVFGDFCLRESDFADAGGQRALRPALAVNVSCPPAVAARVQHEYEDALVEMVRFSRAGPAAMHAITVFTTGTAEDAGPARRVAARLASGGADLFLPQSVGELEALLRSATVVVAGRLHAFVLALATRTPAVGFSPAPKLRNFLGSLGLERYGFGPDGGAELARLIGADRSALWNEQRDAIRRAPLWAVRSRIHGLLRSAASAPAAQRGLLLAEAHRALA